MPSSTPSHARGEERRLKAKENEGDEDASHDRQAQADGKDPTHGPGFDSLAGLLGVQFLVAVPRGCHEFAPYSAAWLLGAKRRSMSANASLICCANSGSPSAAQACRISSRSESPK